MTEAPAPPRPPPRPDGPSATDRWLMGRFGEYYRRFPPELPDRFTRREYGYLFFGPGKFMLRHVGFATRQEFEAFHVRRAPAHSYYSTAFYDRPDAPTMKEKGWKGAELIFDLDADHVPGAEALAYGAQLDRVKGYFLKLVDDFLYRDFGFAERDVVLTFSGGRGYHAHVVAEKALQLDSQERREIVDYVTGTGLDLDLFAQPSTVSGPEGNFVRTKRSMKVARADTPGWGSRLNAGLQDYFRRLKALSEVEQIRALREVPGIGPKESDFVVRQLPLLTEEHVAAGFIDRGPAFRKLVPYVLTQEVIPLAKGETDEPVTSDTKRLIRTPGSLHGKSGLRVVTLTRDDLTTFDPLVDAVVFHDDLVPVTVTKALEVPLKRQGLKLTPGPARIPEWAAVFAMTRGAATPGPDA